MRPLGGSESFWETREGLLDVALPHNRVRPTEAASRLLKSFPPHYEPGALGALVVREAAE